ncbi:MAG: STAS domain-containing protein [Candidatus Sumerlaeia bacterium]|nr:STAS domain-containing protein [Candidatus Sumerlaeia bacterium]
MSEASKPLVVRVPGPRIRLQENEAVREMLMRHVNSGKNRIVLDFQDVEFVDSSFLGLMIVLLKRVTAQGGDLRLCHLQTPLRGIFELMRLDRLFAVYDTETAAVESFQ